MPDLVGYRVYPVRPVSPMQPTKPCRPNEQNRLVENEERWTQGGNG